MSVIYQINNKQITMAPSDLTKVAIIYTLLLANINCYLISQNANRTTCNSNEIVKIQTLISDASVFYGDDIAGNINYIKEKMFTNAIATSWNVAILPNISAKGQLTQTFPNHKYCNYQKNNCNQFNPNYGYIISGTTTKNTVYLKSQQTAKGNATSDAELKAFKNTAKAAIKQGPTSTLYQEIYIADFMKQYYKGKQKWVVLVIQAATYFQASVEVNQEGRWMVYKDQGSGNQYIAYQNELV